MRYSIDWLREYVSLPDKAEEIADRATAIGFAVEALESVGADQVLDLEVNPNRPDVMNHLGLARELAAAYGVVVERPHVEWAPAVEEQSSSDVSIEIQDAAGCPRYAAIAVRDVQVGPSPEWMRRRLEAVGVRPINNIVDITNYVLWEYGQPLHAFDLDRLATAKVIVRRAAAGEHLVTLDGEGRELDSDVLVIADERGAIALAGIMGGASTEVTDGTTSILIESAHFSPSVVRAGARRLSMHTDASHRFERGSDAEVCLEAAQRAATLMAEFAGGSLPETVVDRRLESPWSAFGKLDLERLTQFVGEPVSHQLIETVFPALGFELEGSGENAWRVGVPSWRRFDLEADSSGEIYPAHFYEEALRFHGYERVPATLPAVGGPDEGSSASHENRESLRRQLSAVGLAETITYGFYEAAADDRFPGLARSGSALRLSNALSEQYSTMRRSLLPHVVDGARFNQNRSAGAVRLYEIGHVFPGDKADELEALAVVIGGSTGTPWSRSVDLDFFDLKGIVEGLAERAGLALDYEASDVPGLVDGTACVIRADGIAEPIGYLGQVDESDAIFPLYAAEIWAQALEARDGARVVPPSRFPGVAMDLTLTHPLEVDWASLRAAIEQETPADLQEFGLKDRYQGQGVPEGSVNTTLYFLYNSAERSLTRDEVNERHEKLGELLHRRFRTEE